MLTETKDLHKNKINIRDREKCENLRHFCSLTSFLVAKKLGKDSHYSTSVAEHLGLSRGTLMLRWIRGFRVAGLENTSQRK
jgi:hypothetical protein